MTEATFRAHSRRALHLRATLRLEGSAWQSDGTVLNVGLGGACVALARSPCVGDAVAISFAAPTLDGVGASGEGSIGAEGVRARVQWLRPATESEPARAGIAFDHASPKDVQLLEALLEMY